MDRFINPSRPLARVTQLAAEGEAALNGSARAVRSQAVHRIQIGLMGLTVILLLIGLASVIKQHAQAPDAQLAAPQASASPGDPLADLGVAPELRTAPATPAPAAPPPGAPPAAPARRNR